MFRDAEEISPAVIGHRDCDKFLISPYRVSVNNGFTTMNRVKYTFLINIIYIYDLLFHILLATTTATTSKFLIILILILI